jgi:DNA repair protein RadC
MNQKLYVRDAQGEFVPAERAIILGAAQECLRNRVRRGASLESPASVREYLTVALGDRDCEYFCVILLDLCAAESYVLPSLFSARFWGRYRGRSST